MNEATDMSIQKCSILLFVLMLVSFVAFSPPVLADDTVPDTRELRVLSTHSPTHPFKAAVEHVALAPVTGGGFLGPVIRLQGEVVRLEQRLEKLTVPLDLLEPGTVALTKNMGDIKAQTAELLHQLDSTQTDMRALQIEMKTLRQPVVDLYNPVMQLRTPVTDLQNPIKGLKDPVAKLSDGVFKLEKPLLSVDKGVTELGARFSELDSRFTALDQRFVELDGRFAKLDDRFASLGGQLASLQTVIFGLFVALVVVAAGALLFIVASAIRTKLAKV